MTGMMVFSQKYWHALVFLISLITEILFVFALMPTDVYYPPQTVSTAVFQWAQFLNRKFSFFPSSLIFILQSQRFLGTISYLPMIFPLLLLDMLVVLKRKKIPFFLYVFTIFHPLLYLEMGWNVTHHAFSSQLLVPGLLMAILARYIWVKQSIRDYMSLCLLVLVIVFFDQWILPAEDIIYNRYYLFFIPLAFFERLPYLTSVLFLALFIWPFIASRISLRATVFLCGFGYLLSLFFFPQSTIINSHRWYGAWIWAQEDRNDQYVLFEKHFLWSRQFSKNISIDITAKSAYTVYLNHQFIGAGPGPIDERRQYYDHYDLSAQVTGGKNTITVVAYNYGHPTHFQKKQTGGLLAQLDFQIGPAHLYLPTDKTWHVYRTGWQTIDLAKRGIKEEEINSGIYHEEYVAGATQSAYQTARQYAVGRQEQLVKRDIPYLVHEQISPVRVTEDLDHQWFDFATVIAGYPVFTFTTTTAATAQIQYIEEKNGSIVQTDTVRFNTPGTSTYRVFGRRGMRFIDVFWEYGNGEVSVSVDAVHFPAKQIGSFHSSTASLETIYQLGEQTLTYAMQDQLEDSFIHERSQYLGDSYIDMLSGFYSRDPTLLAKKALYQYAATQRSDGLIETVYPSGLNQTILSFNLLYIQFLKDYFFYTNDRQTLMDLLPVAEKIIQVFEKLQDKNGRISTTDAASLQVGTVLTYWINHTNLAHRPPDTDLSLSALFYSGLDDLESLYAFVDGKKLASLRQKKATFREQLLTTLHEIAMSTIEPHAAVFLINANVLEKDDEKKLYETVLKHPVDPFITGYFNLFYLLAMRKQNDGEGINRILDQYWGSMIRRGAVTTWETYDWRDDSVSVSRTHAWSSGPTYFLPAFIAGIQPLTPGYGSILVRPMLITNAALVTLTTVCGEIVEQWQRTHDAFTLELSTSCPGEIVFQLPFQREEVASVSLNGVRREPIFENDHLVLTSREKKTLITVRN